MGRIISKKNAYLLFLFTGFISGLVIGATAVTIYIGHRLDISHLQINELRISAREKDAQLEKLEESWKKKKFIIKKIDVDLQFDGDELEKTTLVKHIKEQCYVLIGKEVKDIDPDLLANSIDNRIVRLDDRSVKLAVQKLILSDVLKICITATLIRH